MEEPKGRVQYTYGSTLPREWEDEKRVKKEFDTRPRPGFKKQRKVLPKGSVEIIPLSHVLLLGIACVCVLFASIQYLKVRSDIKTLTGQIHSTQSDLSKLSGQNLDTQREIESYVDLDYIYKIATKELGMVPADKDQIIYYPKTESEHVRQNEDIPNE